MAGGTGVDNVFLGGGDGKRNETEVEGLGGQKLLEFEGHHFRSINVRHSAPLSDIIKRLSPHSGCQSISHSVCRHLFFSQRGTNPPFLMLLCASV